MASQTIDWRETPPETFRHGVVSIGNFDGVHRGHATLLASVRAQARTLGVPAVILTFDPHPLSLLRPGPGPLPLTSLADRAQLLQTAGADQVVILRSTRDLLALSPSDFFTEVIQHRLAASALVEGFNFGFGRDRAGTVETLGELCRKAAMPLTIVPPQRLDDQEISSSRIRTLLQGGDVSGAEFALGRPYRLHGIVGVGQRRGRTIGFPTANLDPLLTMPPGDGVYAVRVPIGDRPWPAAANVGPNPTFGEDARKIEIHLIDYQGDLYGQHLAVDFVARLRDTRTFPSLSELIEQLRRDVEAAKTILEKS